MTDTPASPGDSRSDEMSEYLQMFLDETEEQLDDLVEALLVLEGRPDSIEALNEAFRLIHSIKGASGMMGLDNIAILTHHLENRFEAFRSRVCTLDQSTMNLVLRCIDFLRECTGRLRTGQQLGSAAQLLEALAALEDAPPASPEGERQAAADEPADPLQQASPVANVQPTAPVGVPAARSSAELPELGRPYHMTICFESGLRLADLKARLILARLSEIAEISAAVPTLEELEALEEVAQFDIHLSSDASEQELHRTADVDGVGAIQFHDLEAPVPAAPPVVVKSLKTASPSRSDERSHQPADSGSSEAAHTTREMTAAPLALPDDQDSTETPPAAVDPQAPAPVAEAAPTPGTDKSRARVVETMRVDLDRLDNLMNLAGELVVNRARFVQVAGQVNPALRKRSVFSRSREFNETLRHTIERLEHQTATNGEFSADLEALKSGLNVMEQQTEMWDEGRRSLAQITEAIDQLTRISDSLQRGVLDTRMVPVGPLFNRFKRVVRDLSIERGKKVQLEIRGEKTELDKRMIDELADPLVHLVRNSIDHGLEPPEVRLARGKSEAGRIVLEASHSGNNIFIYVRDDGGGIDVAKIKQRLVDKNILPAAAVDELSNDKALQYIWHAGFSTAGEVTDISGRGVGMDVVKTRISELNGTIEIDSQREQGTTFTLRLPLTLAIINSLLIRIRDVIFAMPIEDVREIVSLHATDIVTVRGKQTFDVRGEFVPLVSIDDIFEWNSPPRATARLGTAEIEPPADSVSVVILHARGKTAGLRVDELLGSQDIVIKSLTENFVHIRGLSGASILGDGTVCLMLDVATAIDMAVKPACRRNLPQGNSI